MPEQAQLTGTATDLHLFVPITRVDDEERIVIGYCFVNETVDGEGGIRLMRSAMEEATEDYMRWGAVREMHQPSAVGTALADGCGITWDEKGAELRAKIVDDAAWQKVKEGVYRGFSLGARPKVMRGRDVSKVAWVENSLVDRPRDPDCPFTLFRVDGADEPAETDVPAEEAEADAAETPAAEAAEETERFQREDRVTVTGGEAGTVVGWLEGADPAPQYAVLIDGETFPRVFPAGDVTRGAVEATVEESAEEPAAETVEEAVVEETLEEVDRAATSATVPSRENLEGGVPDDGTDERLHGVMHYDCGAKTCHGHRQQAAARRCAETQRGEGTEEADLIRAESGHFITVGGHAVFVGSGGSEGEKVDTIGHTQTGKAIPTPTHPVYQGKGKKTVDSFPGWSAQDHEDAYQAHAEAGRKAYQSNPNQAHKPDSLHAQHSKAVLVHSDLKKQVAGKTSRAAGLESDPLADVSDLTRLQTLETENTDLLQRLETLETDLTARDTELADVRRSLSAAEERAAKLAKEPLPITAVAPGVTLNRGDRRPAERSFALNDYDPDGTQSGQSLLLQRYAELAHLPPDVDQAANEKRADEMLQLREVLRYRFGVAVP